MKKIAAIVLSFGVIFSASAKEDFEGPTYYYWSDAEGKWSFQFSESGDFLLYDTPRELLPIVDLPGYGGEVQASLIKGKYKIQKDTTSVTVKVGSRSFLVTWLDDKYCFLYEVGKEHRVFRGINQKYLDDRKRIKIGTPEFEKFISVSSSLSGQTKGGIGYRPPFHMLAYDSVWAYSDPRPGVGWLTLLTSGPIGGILIVNGLVMPSQPEYFKYNRRAKLVRISNGSTAKEFTLDDSMNPQEIPFSITDDGEIKIEVIDYYNGSRFDDTVVSFVGTFR